MKQYTRLLLIMLFLTVIKEQSMQAQQANNNNIQHTRFIKVNALYKHYSGKLYKVIAIAHDSEDPSLLRVIYQGLYDCPTFGLNPVWDRPYTMFAEHVVINGVEQPRFTEVEVQ
jgi:hypothetical protein